MMNPAVNSIATGPLTSVLIVTPTAMTITACTQMLVNTLAKLAIGEPSGWRR